MNTYHISNSVLLRSCIEDEQFMRVWVSLQYQMEIPLIFPAAFVTNTDQWLGTSGDGRLCVRGMMSCDLYSICKNCCWPYNLVTLPFVKV